MKKIQLIFRWISCLWILAVLPACSVKPSIRAVNQFLQNLILDQTPPSVSILSPTSVNFINTTNQNLFTVSGTCTSGDGPVIITAGTVFSSVICTNDAFSSSLDLSGLPDGAVIITATQIDASLNAATDTVTVTKDTALPTISINHPLNQGLFNAVTQSSVSVSGECSVEVSGQMVSVVASDGVNDVTQFVVCGSSTPYPFSVTLDLSPLAEGPISLTASVVSASGNPAQDSISITKDITPPLTTGLTWSMTPPNGSVSAINTPIISLNGSEISAALSIFSNSSCTGFLGATLLNGSGNGIVNSTPLSGDGLKSFWFTLIDIAGNATPCVSTGLSYTLVAAPNLSTPASQIFATSSAVLQGAPIIPLDWNNLNTNSDASMTYSCKFDRFVDGSAASGTSCGSLLGTKSFNASTGILTWTPGMDAWGPYEICVTGTNLAGTSVTCAVVDVKLNYGVGKLIGYFDAGFAALNGGQGMNGALWGARDLVLNQNLSLYGFAQTTSSGFNGFLPDLPPNEKTNPYRLVYDGSFDQLAYGTNFNANIGFAFDTWISSFASTIRGKVILSNGDSLNQTKGMTLSQSRLLDQSLQLTLGRRSYVDEVLVDNPIGFYRLNDAGPPFSNLANSSMTASAINTVGYAQATKPVKDNRAKSISLNPTGIAGQYGSVNLSHSTINALFNPGNSFSVEIWVNPVLHPTNWRWILSKAFTSHVSPYYQFDIRHFSNGAISATMWRSDSFAAHLTVNNNAVTNPLVLNAWNHIVVTYSQTNPATTLKLYLNGLLLDTKNTPSGTYSNFNTPLIVGENYNLLNNNTYSFKGNLSDVSLYNYALPPDRVKSHFMAAGVPTCFSTTPLANNAWFHVGGSYSLGSTSDLTLHVNGVNECTVTQAATYAGSDGILSLGTDPGGSLGFKGAIGEFRFYHPAAVLNTIPDNFNVTKIKYPGF